MSSPNNNYPATLVGHTVSAPDMGFGIVLEDFLDDTLLIKWEDAPTPQVVDADSVELADAPQYWGPHAYDLGNLHKWF